MSIKMIKKTYDSTEDTNAHRNYVKRLMESLSDAIVARAAHHDDSKLVPPEKQLFDEYSPKLKGCTYGSAEYKEFLSGLKPALDHHYVENRHHPEHFENGIAGMDLIDVLEMICDWYAASKRHDDGDIRKSLEINRKRFNISDQLNSILENTVLNYLEK